MTLHYLFLIVFAFAVSASAERTNVTVTSRFEDEENFSLAEFSATLEACVGGPLSSKNKSLQIRCLKELVSPTTSCFEVSAGDVGALLCDVEGVPVSTENTFLHCGETCPLQNLTLAAQDCSTRLVPGFTKTCFPSALCQITSEEVFSGSFGDFCPSSTGKYCCSSDAEEDNDFFAGSLLVSPSSVDYLRDVSHITDLSFRIHYEVTPPALLKITVDVPYVTSDRKVVFVENGVNREYSMCPTTYMIDFADPIEALPRAEAGYFKRTELGGPWMPLQYSSVSDLVGRPRTACGNYDFTYSSEASFRANFKFPDTSNSSSRLTYGRVPKVDEISWPLSQGSSGVPSPGDTFWKMSSPADGRVNYTTEAADSSFYDLVKTFYKCKNYATSERLVTKTVEQEMTYINGVPYNVETYDWNIHICQVGYFGRSCDDPSLSQMYAKTCAVVPASFSIAPQQVSHVSTTPSSSKMVSKTFLQSVDAFSSNCTTGHERIAITLSLVVFETDYELYDEKVHDVIKPEGIFEKSHMDVNFFNITHTSVFDFLQSHPEEEGIYKMQRVVTTEDAVQSYYQKIIIISKCYYTGLDTKEKTRSTPTTFADAVKDANDKVYVEVEFVLRKKNSQFDLRNTLNIIIIATSQTFVLQNTVLLTQSQGVASIHRLYNSYEAAKSDTLPGLLEGIIAEGDTVVYEGDQVCSKHQMATTSAQSVLLSPNAVGACVLTAEGEEQKDGSGIRLAGREIMYRANGMETFATYVFGCTNDWLDITTKVASPEGVYYFETIQRLENTHESRFWFVKSAILNHEQLGSSAHDNKMSDLFGTGIFYYDSNAGKENSEISEQMEVDSITAQFPTTELSAGCVEEGGNLKGACNLVCFKVVSGLLTPSSRTNATLLVHHISVASVATEEQIRVQNTFSSRRLLQDIPNETHDEGKVQILRIYERHSPEVPNDWHHSRAQRPENYAFFLLILIFFILFFSLCYFPYFPSGKKIGKAAQRRDRNSNRCCYLFI
jgi:hypothetical protein